ncbi:hypothetical protein [Cupriavidus basilensis]|nr:hypothetical protein [Cupriavidus basilensis]
MTKPGILAISSITWSAAIAVLRAGRLAGAYLDNLRRWLVGEGLRNLVG